MGDDEIFDTNERAATLELDQTIELVGDLDPGESWTLLVRAPNADAKVQ